MDVTTSVLAISETIGKAKKKEEQAVYTSDLLSEESDGNLTGHGHHSR